MRARVRLVPLAVLGALVLSSCALGPSQRPPVAIHGASVTGPPPSAAPARPGQLPMPEPQDPLISYTDCTADTLSIVTAAGFPVPPGRLLSASCGEINVPADPGRGTPNTVRLGVLRVSAAAAPRNRPPLVVVGDSTAGGSARLAGRLATLVSDGLLAQYQLIGLDRRGTGSDLLDCAPEDARIALVDVPPVPAEAPLAGLLENARELVQSCYQLLDTQLGTVRTAATAADLEVLRAQLRVPRLNAIGLGDGATAVAAWAATHPRSIGRIVLDSPVDLATDEPDRTEARVAATESTFDVFLAACVARGGCPLPPDARAAVSAIVAGLDARPLLSATGDRVTGGGALAALRAGLPDPSRWPALAEALAAAGRGDPTGLITFLGPLLGNGGTYDTALATRCNDTSRRLAPPEVAQLAERWAARSPLFGAAAAHGLLACGPWPSGTGAPALTPVPPEAPPLLVLTTAADPLADEAGSRKVAQLLGRTVTVGWEGAGQGAYPRSTCITSAVEQVLLAGRLPRDGTVCPA